MSKNRQKQYTISIRALVKELSGLRKGSGLHPSKLRDKMVLKTLASRYLGSPITSLTGSQIYTFLLGEVAKIKDTPHGKALYVALGVEPSSAVSLLHRRAQLGQLLGKHPDTVERYENKGLAELAARLIENAPAEASGLTEPTTYLRQLEEQVAMARAATTFNLSGLLSLNHRAEEFVKYLEVFRRPYLDATITITLKPSRRGKGWYRIDARYIFQGRYGAFRVAAVTNNEDGQRLMKLGLIDEFHKINDMTNPTREMKALVDASTLTLHNPTTRQQKLLRFKAMTAVAAQQILQSVEEPLEGTCHLLEITVPPEWETPETVFEYRNSLNLREDLRYAYWYAPGIMYVKKLTFDYSEFPGASERHFKVLPFLGHISGDDVFNPEGCSFTFHLNSWLMPGNGVGLAWE